MSDISKFQSLESKRTELPEEVAKGLMESIGADGINISKNLNGSVDEIDFAALADFIGGEASDYLEWGTKFMVQGAHNPKIYARLEVLEKYKRNQEFLSKLEISQEFLKSIMIKNSFDTKSLINLHKKVMYVRKLLFPNRDKIEFLLPN